VLHLGPILGLTFVELKELRVAQGGEERKGAGACSVRGGGARGCWWLGLGSPDYRYGHIFAAAMGACAGGVFGDGYCIYTVFACRKGGVVLDSATL
jgi:hypothetical protein